MKRIIKITLVLITFLLIQISCKKEFLEPTPLSFYAPENVYVNKAGFEAGLVTVRKDLLNDFYGDRSHLCADTHGTDLGNMTFASDWNTVTPSSGTYLPILPMFARIYGYIKNTNVIISRIDDIKWSSDADRNAILSQAYFYRSWWYYRLVNTYGDVPFLGKELKEAKLDFFTHSKWAILKKIQSDMEYAVQWLPATPPNGQPSKYAGLHLLAKIYMENTEFDKAIDAATSVINGPFALMTARFGAWLGDKNRNLLWDLHRPENKALAQNTEDILILIDRSAAPAGAKTVGTYTMRNYTPTWWHNNVKDSKGLHGTRDVFADGTRTPMYDTLGRGNPDITAVPWASYTNWYDGTYTWRNTPDMRRSNINWVDCSELLYNEPTSVDYRKPFNPAYFALLSDSLTTMFPFPHYKTWFPHEAGFTGRPMGGNGDYYVFRLAETYLIRAEAYFWKNKPDLAADDINKVRERSKALPITSADVTLDFIFDERTRELYLEEMRHTELVRAALILAKLNKDGYSLAAFTTKNWFYDRVMSRNKFYQLGLIGSNKFTLSPYNVFWPIDVNVITANTMGVINQNEGYQGAENNQPPLETIE
ncbi:MAG: RagB/SusD family nutrient uptake outer membrane protein [Bacteroidales bacterium]|nr:RagB/SusD family nutrient uptake outer membrane protein [Bacteroidales bacterium]